MAVLRSAMGLRCWWNRSPYVHPCATSFSHVPLHSGATWAHHRTLEATMSKDNKVAEVTEDVEPFLITREAAGELASVGPRTVDRWANEGLIKRYKLGRLQWVRFDSREVEAMRRPVAEGAGTTTGE